MSAQPLKVNAFSGGHWYTQDAELILEVEKAKKGTGFTKTTLRHARKLDLAPGCTTIIKQAHAEQLVNWRINQAVMAAKTLDQQDGEDDRAYLQRVYDDANTHAREAAEKGQACHSAIEAFFNGESYAPEYAAHVAAVVELLHEHVGPEAAWEPEKAVMSPYGYCTKADLVSTSKRMLVDFKTCDGSQEDLDAKKTWDTHHMQLGATADCFDERLDTAILYVSRSHPGAAAWKPVPFEKQAAGLCMFTGLLAYWQAKNSYRPSWAKAVF